jgi:hypothetical protein
MVYLALRTTSLHGFFPRLFAAVTRWRLQTIFPHSGIVVDETLYHTNKKNGLHEVPFESEGWELYPIKKTPEEVKALFEAFKGAKYDWFGLLAFILPWRVSKSDWLYCYEWSYLVITGKVPNTRITPEILLHLVLKEKTHD